MHVHVITLHAAPGQVIVGAWAVKRVRRWAEEVAGVPRVVAYRLRLEGRSLLQGPDGLRGLDPSTADKITLACSSHRWCTVRSDCVFVIQKGGGGGGGYQSRSPPRFLAVVVWCP